MTAFLKMWKECWGHLALKVVWQGKTIAIHVGDVVWAVVFLAAGGVVSRWLGNMMRRRMEAKDVLSATGREAAARWAGLAVLFFAVMAAMRALGLPLGVFGFLGGAVALGFGFGAQNVCNNLISGVIILVTQPYRKGDVVEVDGRAGTVESVGLRATEVRTYAGVDLLVPNSHFLQNTIVNRSHYDQPLRGDFAISVEYGVDTRAVEAVLTGAAKEHPAVVKEEGKEPWAWLEDFGDSGILYRVYFWVDTRVQGVAATTSDIRHAAYAALQAGGIGVPYPKMDVTVTKG
jgi:small-conductance mechanosensitive channel